MEEFIAQFAVDIWNQAANCVDFNSLFEENVSLTVTLMYYSPYLFYELTLLKSCTYYYINATK